MRRNRRVMALVLVALAVLACNAPGGQPTQAPPPTVTPFVPQGAETPASPPPTEPSPTPEVPSPTLPPPTPTPEVSPTSPPPTPTPPPVSAGPLDFPEPTTIDGYQALPDGGNEVTIIIHITGGAPPFTIHHDVDVFETWERDYPLVFRHDGCTAIVHTITVESADGQTVSHDYWIPVEALPWCQ